MKIDWIKLEGYRNYNNALINFADHTLIIGANDVGKSNLLYALRILLDKTLSEAAIEPVETDFHINKLGQQADELSLIIKISDIKEDAILSQLKGNVSENKETFLCYKACRKDLSYNLFSGAKEEFLEKLTGRYQYLKYIFLRYIQSSRDLISFVRTEKKNLLMLSKKKRSEEAIDEDNKKEYSIQKKITSLNQEIGSLSYIADATNNINNELEALSHHNSGYSVCLEAQAIDLSTYIEQLSLTAKNNESSIGLGGDGRNNQILLALWKAKSEQEVDIASEALLYCIEEPEAHLHPHQQRKFARYLVDNLKGQLFVTTHSPQITEHFEPDKIVRILNRNGEATAASNGCSLIVDKAWKSFGYRMSIIPAEAFFADAVFLVEGPSEEIFFHALARTQKIDLDFLNISILSVAGISFKVYAEILRALEIPFVIRTDNDILKVPKNELWQCSGLNRALKLNNEDVIPHFQEKPTHEQIISSYGDRINTLKQAGIYLSKIDLEADIVESLPEPTRRFSEETDTEKIISYFKEAKAIRMQEFIMSNGDALASDDAWGTDFMEPLFFLKNIVQGHLKQ